MSTSKTFDGPSRFFRKFRIALFALLVVSTLAAVEKAFSAEQLWSEIGNGGIVLFRHALAPGTGDPEEFDLADCSTQRNLDDRGRERARAIGAAFRSRGIKVGKVLTSQWCRCRETADLAFPGKVTEAPVFNSFFETRSAGPDQTRATLDLLEAWSGPGALVVVTHQVNITALTGVFPSSGEGIVIRIEDAAPTTVGRLNI